MFLTGFTNHLLITFHLRRCQYHIKVINDLRQFCITVGFRVYIIPPWAFPAFPVRDAIIPLDTPFPQINKILITLSPSSVIFLMNSLSIIFKLISILRASYPLGKEWIDIDNLLYYNK